jgi:hypothetical protein
MAASFVIDVMSAAPTIVTILRFIPPIMAPFLSSTKRLHRQTAESTTLFQQVIIARHERAKDPTVAKADDILQWFIDTQRGEATTNIDKISQWQLGVIFASVHNTTLVLTNA